VDLAWSQPAALISVKQRKMEVRVMVGIRNRLTAGASGDHSCSSHIEEDGDTCLYFEEPLLQ